MQMVICGTCYTLVTADEDDQECPRCHGPINPGPETRLRQFVDHGTDPAKGGVRLRDAQDSASQVLAELTILRIQQVQPDNGTSAV